MIIFRYLTREVFFTLLATTLVLLAIFICNQFVRYLGDAAIGRVTAEAVLQLMAIQVPLLSGFMLPLGYFIAVLLTYSRLYADSEMIILFSSGMSRLRLLWLTARFALVVALGVAVLMLWIEPKMAWYRDHFLAQAAAASPVDKMAPGRFHVVGGRWVFYVEGLSRDREAMKKIFAATMPGAEATPDAKNSLLFARRAKQVQAEGGRRFIEFEEGARYVGNPGDVDYQVMKFDKYGVHLPDKTVEISKQEEFTPSWELWQDSGNNPLAAAELQWRLSMPLSVLILMLYAVPLSRVRPRQGRFARFFPAIIVYTVYIDLLFVSQSWVQKGLVSSGIGMWWVHGLMLLGGGALSAHYVGLWEWRRKR